MKKILCCIFALCLLLPCLAGCKFMTLSDAEARAELERLLPKAKELTDVFYGKGLPYIPLSEDSTDFYAYVSADSPYKTIGEMKEAAAEVFSKEYQQTIYAYAFEGNEYNSSRYFAVTDNSGPSHIKINLKLEPLSMLQEIDISDAKVIEGTPAACVVRVKAKNSSGKVFDKEIKLVKQNGKWLLDGAAY